MDEKDKEKGNQDSDNIDERLKDNSQPTDETLNSEDNRFITQGQGINPSNPLWQLQSNIDKQKKLSSNNSGDNLSASEKYLLAGDVIAKTDELKTATQSLQVNELERIYFDRKVKPMVDLIWELSTAAQNFAGMSNLFQANNYGKKREVKKSLDLAIEILKEADDLWGLVKTRVEFFKNNIDPYE